ncbi:phosphoribosylanthranilate isomerase [Derxia gummosa]|uniref:N-(5'-phosphoribosyl)anthranilate isomerase n=1 Tax=Derxia gummosa DSM 723 TaxID=1121388 RepID=A0A8B6X674_9BURK|nr:phosphoribosylanthranilate isomerase [Derxia gummosa]
MIRTRIKYCGLTREDDLAVAIDCGVDAIGFVAYARSPRFVGAARAAELAELLPPFVTPVVLFVNPTRDEVAAYLDLIPGATLQFHGDETPAECGQFGNPWIKAARVAADGRVAGADCDLASYAARYVGARAILLDAHSDGFGGAGKTFDWRLASGPLALPVVLSGGLDASNVGAGMAAVTPLAVDVSSGIERSRGIKDADKMRSFAAAVRAADDARHRA